MHIMDQLMVCVWWLECLAKITLDTYSSLAGFLSRHGYVLSIHVFVSRTQHGLRFVRYYRRFDKDRIGATFCDDFWALLVPPYCCLA
jgi:hypothetical protein